MTSLQAAREVSTARAAVKTDPVKQPAVQPVLCTDCVSSDCPLRCTVRTDRGQQQQLMMRIGQAGRAVGACSTSVSVRSSGESARPPCQPWPSPLALCTAVHGDGQSVCSDCTVSEIYYGCNSAKGNYRCRCKRDSHFTLCMVPISNICTIDRCQ